MKLKIHKAERSIQRFTKMADKAKTVNERAEMQMKSSFCLCTLKTLKAEEEYGLFLNRQFLSTKPYPGKKAMEVKNGSIDLRPLWARRIESESDGAVSV